MTLAAALQQGVQQFAKVWYQLRAVRVFRDKTVIVPGQGLTSAIKSALDESEYFVLLASPLAVASEWVQQEVDWWISRKGAENMLIVLTDGQISWSRESGDFDWTRTNALPKSLAGLFKEEPVHLNLRWAKTGQELSLANPQFREVVADLASALRNISRDVLDGEDVRQFKRARWFRRSAAIAVTALAVAAVAAAILAYHQRGRALVYGDQALKNKKIADERDVAAKKSDDLASAQTKVARSLELSQKAARADGYTRLNLYIQAIEAAPAEAPATQEAANALRALLDEAFQGLLKNATEESLSLRSAMAVDALGRRIAVATPYWSALALDLGKQSKLDLCGRDPIEKMWFSPNARYLLLKRGQGMQVWDVEARRQMGEIQVGRTLSSEDEEQYDGGGFKTWFTPDSSAFITRSKSGNMGLWALPSLRQIAELPDTKEDDTVVFNKTFPIFLTYGMRRLSGTSASMWTLGGKLLWRPDPVGFYWAAFYNRGSSLVGSMTFNESGGSERLEVYSWTVGKDGVPQKYRKWTDSDFDLAQLAGEPRETILGVRPLPFSECKNWHPAVTTNGIICTGERQPELYEAADARHVGPLPNFPFPTIRHARTSSDGTLAVLEGQGLAVWEAASRSFLWKKDGVQGPAVFSDDNQRVLAFNNGAPSAFEAKSGKTIASATGSNSCTPEIQLYAYEERILWTDRKGKRLIARTPHDLCVWDMDRGKLLQRLNLFTPELQRIEEDRKSLNRYSPQELTNVARKFLTGCTPPNAPGMR